MCAERSHESSEDTEDEKDYRRRVASGEAAEAWAERYPGKQQHGSVRVTSSEASTQVLTAAREAQQELAQSGDSGNDSKISIAELQSGQKAVTIPTQSIAACVKSGRHRRALPRSGRQFDSTHDAQQIQEEVDAHYEFRDPNSTQHHWDLLPRFPALSSCEDHEALNDSQSSSSDGPPPLVSDESDDARFSCISRSSSIDEEPF